MNWISVEDRLPETNVDVFIAAGRSVSKGYWHRSNVWYCYDRGYFTSGINYWMPLPEPPEKGGE